MILVSQAQDTFRLVALSLAILNNIALTLIILLASPWIVRKPGVTGQKIVAKIMGLITLVIGMSSTVQHPFSWKS